MANENSIRDALAFYEEISNEIRRAYKELFLFIDTFSRVYKREKLKLPYHVNIIEELHINENAHSRILLKFLLYQNDNGKYEIFQSLLEYIRRNNDRSNMFGDIKITKPILTQEIARIDMWIRDKNYAIIFENKARNAVDQDSQLSRYIERTINRGYKKEQIFVIYMPPTLKEPAEQSWGTYEEEFKKRYFCLSFREHVLPWLKNDVIPNVRQKDLYLSSALVQYVDYLEYTIFKMSEIYKNMNMELKKIITSHLELEKKTPVEQVHLLDEKITSIVELKSQMEELKEQIQIKYIANIVDSNKGDLDIHVEKYKVTTVVEDAIVELNANNKGFYCTIYYKDFKNIEEDSILLKFIDDNILDTSDDKYVWKYLTTDIECFEDLFKLFLKVIKKYRDEYFKQQSAIKKLKGKLQELQELPEKKDEWHIWHGWILAVSFNDNTEKKIGIESNFEEENGNACAKFKIFITTWGNHDESLNSWNLYETAIMKESKYGDFDLDKGETAGGNGRVYLHVTKRKGSDTDGIDGSNTDGIIEKLSECYSFLEKLEKDVAKE
ncbi:MAG: PD-(D/E)XK nuclease family protein [Bacteroidales bacterium]|nr:PD-(D/E)XK nuclease family protein [Bacteroidales bacterium]